MRLAKDSVAPGRGEPDLRVRGRLRGLLPGHPAAGGREHRQRRRLRGRHRLPLGRLHVLRLHRRSRTPTASPRRGPGIRIVWHHKASDEDRTFTVRYRVAGLVKAYDDILDVYWKVWGDQWEDKLDHLEATFTDRLDRARADDPREAVGRLGPPADRRGRDLARAGARAASRSTTSTPTSSSRCASWSRGSPARTSAAPWSSRATGSRRSSTRRTPRPTTSTAPPRRRSGSSATTPRRSRWASASSACSA